MCIYRLYFEESFVAMELFLAVKDTDKPNFAFPLSSCALLYIIRYCSVSSVKVTLVKVSATKHTCIDVKLSCFDGICYTCIDEKDISQKVNNCELPVIQVSYRINSCYPVKGYIIFVTFVKDSVTMSLILCFENQRK